MFFKINYRDLMFFIFPYRYTPVPDSILAKAGLPGDSVAGLDPVMSFKAILIKFLLIE